MNPHSKLGERLEMFRKRKGWTQEELAKKLGLARTIITQIEKGNRKITADELFEFSKELQFPIEDIFMDEKLSEPEVFYQEDVAQTAKIRVSVPPAKLNYSKFKNILLYVLEKCAGKPNVGETVLYKLLYFADFNHFEVHEKFLTHSVYRKLPYGPVPMHFDIVIEKMIKDGELQKISSDYFGLAQKRYLPLVKPELNLLTGAEKETLDQVIDRYSDWSARAISDFSHKDIPWRATQDGGIIDYELAFYREPPFSARMFDYEEPEVP